jgi:hypothetical protein
MGYSVRRPNTPHGIFRLSVHFTPLYKKKHGVFGPSAHFTPLYKQKHKKIFLIIPVTICANFLLSMGLENYHFDRVVVVLEKN